MWNLSKENVDFIAKYRHIDNVSVHVFEAFKGRTGDVTFAKLWTSPVLPKYGQDISGFSMG